MSHTDLSVSLESAPVDLHRFAQPFAALGSRRRVLALLAALPVVAGLGEILDPAETDAKDRRRRRKQRHKRRKKPGSRKKHKSRKCKPDSVVQTCAGRCGSILNTCKQAVDCVSCACEPTCQVCFTCQEGPTTPGACVVDPAQAGETCGLPGQRCQPDGACTCDEGSCPAAAPFCVAGVCEPCTSHAQCGGAAICVDKVCQACDVCQLPAECAFTSVQAAIDAPAQLETIHVCPGTYDEDAMEFGAVSITRALRLIGAGDDADDTANTILVTSRYNKAVVRVDTALGVTLQGLRMTGGTGPNGRGLHVQFSQAEVNACTMTGNRAQAYSGGLGVFESSVTLTDSRVTTNFGFNAGGVQVLGSGATLTLDTKSQITENSSSRGPGGLLLDGAETSVALPSEDNVTGNISSGAYKNCEGDGIFAGPGAICTTR